MLFNVCNCAADPALISSFGPLCAGGAGFVSAMVGAMVANAQTAQARPLGQVRARGGPAGGADRHRQHRDPVRADREARRPHHRAALRRQHHAGRAAARGAQRRVGTCDARGVAARRRDPQRAGRFRLHLGGAQQQPGDPQDRPVDDRCHGAEPRPLRSFRRHGRLSRRPTRASSRASCRSSSAARTPSASARMPAAISARSTGARSSTPTSR